MRITILNRPATIGVLALFAEVPGEWTTVDNTNTHAKVSEDGVSVFMLKEDMAVSLSSFDTDDRNTIEDAEKLSVKFEAMFDNDTVSADDAQIFTKEQGADNVDFSKNVAENVQLIKFNVLNDEMRTFDNQISKFLKGRSDRDIDFLAHAFEREFSKREVRSRKELAEIAFQKQIRN